MNEHTDELNLKDRLDLIERMIAEGRRKTESWGWTFVLWGVAYYVATAWATWTKSYLAWPVTMIAASVITAVVGSRISRGQPETTLGRSIGAIWTAMGISIFILLMSLAYSGHYGDGHVSVAIFGAMLGSANTASAILLKWKIQFACAAVWLASTVVACFGSDSETTIGFLAAIFFCQIVFGIYAIICDARRRHARALHA